MKIIVNESQYRIIFEQSQTDDEWKKYRKIMEYRQKVSDVLKELGIKCKEIHKLYIRFLGEPTQPFDMNSYTIDYFLSQYSRGENSSSFHKKKPEPLPSYINLEIFKNAGFTEKELSKMKSLMNEINIIEKKLYNIEPPDGYVVPVYYQKILKHKKSSFILLVNPLIPLIPLPEKPKTEPVVQSIPDKKTEFEPKWDDQSIYGPARSLIGFMRGRNFIPATGKYTIGMNEPDRILLNNKIELNKYIQNKFGAYANPIN